MHGTPYTSPGVKYRIARTLRRNGATDRDLLNHWLHLQSHSEWQLTHQAEFFRYRLKQLQAQVDLPRMLYYLRLYNIFADTVRDYTVPF